MIKFRYNYPNGFIGVFKEQFVLNRSIQRAIDIYEDLLITSPTDAVVYEEFFSRSSILSFVFCKGKNLKSKIDEVYGKYPLIADRFCPAWIFNNYSFKFELLDLDLSSEANKTVLTSYKNELCAELEKIEDEVGSKLARNLIVRLEALRTANNISKLLSRIQYVCIGRSRLSNKIENMYPAWFKDIQTIFDYEKLRADYGLEIISSSGLEACPYCNARKIETVLGINGVGSPDLDHFYPKSSYPFLATTLSNLIPSCWYCNQKFKREKDTYNGHLHPLLKGTDSYNVFNFTPTLDEQPEIMMNGCPAFRKNISLFELEAVYDSRAYRETYTNITDLLDMHKGIRGNMNKVVDDKRFFDLTFSIGRNRTSKNTIDHKFRLDILSHLTHNHYKT